MAIPQVTGVNTELLGLADRQQPGILEIQRKKAGMTILTRLFENLRSYRRTRGRVLLYFIEEYIADGRLIRITGEDGIEQYVPLMKDPDTKKYDIIVDEAPNSPNQKEETFAVLSQVMPQIQAAGLPMPPEILDYVPLPSTLTEKWKKMLEAQKQDPKQIDELAKACVRTLKEIQSSYKECK